MDQDIASPLIMEPARILRQEPLTVDYESEDEKEDSELQLRWSRIMDEGQYKTSSTYTKVEVLLLCWEDNFSDMATKQEIDDLKATFENRFNYHAEIKYLNTTKLQVRMNHIVAAFVEEHDGPNTLLIVYYAGHGKPGSNYGDLELFGETSPNDKKKCLDILVWNKTEAILMPAEADVLEIFDCCYAGQLGLRTKGQRSFEYLAATQEMGVTMKPGKDSFTRGLIHALEALLKERSDGRFTTVELLNKIKEAPHFPKDQNPILVDREKKRSAGRIMLHPLKGKGSNGHSSPEEAARLEAFKGHTLTLHFDFSKKPSPTYIETFGRELNDVFARRVDVNRVRWGGMKQAMAARYIKVFQAIRKRRQSMRPQQANLNNSGFDARQAQNNPDQANNSDSFSDARRSQSASDPLTPASLGQHSPRTMDPAAKGSPDMDPADMSLLRPPNSNDESEGQVQDHREGRKRRRSAVDSESSS